MAKTEKPLTVMQELFAEQMLVCKFNQYEAAVAAGYSKGSARSAGTRLASDPRIAKLIKKHKDGYRRKADRENKSVFGPKRKTLEDVIQELENIAFADIVEMFDGGDWLRIKNPDELPVGLRRAISDIRIKPGENLDLDIQVKFHSKVEALKTLEKYVASEKPKEPIAIKIEFETPPSEEGSNEV